MIGPDSNKHQPARIKRPPINKVLILEALLMVLISSFWWQWDKITALSILYGGFIFIIPSAYFAWRSFQHMGAAKAQLVAQGFYRGQATKFILTTVMFAAVFIVVKPLNVLALFIVYGLTAVLHFIATGWLLNKS